MLKIKVPKYDIFQGVMLAVIGFITLLGFYYAYQIVNFTFSGVSDFMIFVGAMSIITLEVLLLLVIVVYEVLTKIEIMAGQRTIKENLERAITVDEFASAYAKFGGKPKGARSRVKKVTKVTSAKKRRNKK